MLTASYLRERLEYDRETGVFTWRPLQGSDRETRRWNTRFAGRAAGTTTTSGHRSVRIDDWPYAAHRLAWLYVTGEWPPIEVDHKNRVRDDNRWSNLRSATRSENVVNTRVPSRNTSGSKGVWQRRRNGQWVARIGVRGERLWLGEFATFSAAKSAYDAASVQHFGEFAL